MTTPPADDDTDVVLTIPDGRWGWLTLPHPAPEVLEVHIMPALDLGLHAFDGGCACHPCPDQVRIGVWHHHSYDGREAYEMGVRKRH